MPPIVIQALVTVICCFITTLPAILYARKGLKQGEQNGKTGDLVNQKIDTAAVVAKTVAVSAGVAATKAGVAATKAESAAVIAQNTSDKSDELIASTKVIHELVNSGSDALKAEIAKLREALAAALARQDRLTATIERLLASAEARQATGLDRRAPATT